MKCVAGGFQSEDKQGESLKATPSMFEHQNTLKQCYEKVWNYQS